MKKSAKVALGIANIIPFVLYVALPIVMIASIPNAEHSKAAPPTIFATFFTFYIFIMLAVFGLMIFYIVNVFQNERLPGEKKALWAVVLFLGNVLAFPFYWYFYIWSTPKEAAQPALAEAKFEGDRMYCSKCGAENHANNFKCTSCGYLLHPAQPTPASTNSYGAVGSIIPYRNSSAIAAYYLGVFSAIPVFGIVLGIIALVLGIKGRRVAKEHPELKGGLHAWFGILAGGFFALAYTVLTIWLFQM